MTTTQPVTDQARAVMKRCQVGISSGTKNALGLAHDLLAECYGTIGRLINTSALRDERQGRVHEWCGAAFGAEHASSLPQRAIRAYEEDVETYQAAMHLAGFGPIEARAMAHRMLDYVMDREPGDLFQELGGKEITTLALAAAAGISADAAGAAELERVLAKPLAHFHARNQVKNDAGFDVTGAA